MMMGEGTLKRIIDNWDKYRPKILEMIDPVTSRTDQDISALEHVDRMFRNGPTMKSAPAFKFYQVPYYIAISLYKQIMYITHNTQQAHVI